MNMYRLKCLVWVGLLAFAVVSRAEEFTAKHFLPTASEEAQWTFSGVIADEEEQQYGYYFQLARIKDRLSARAALFDVDTKKVLTQYQADALLTEDAVKAHHYHVGHAFLQFNPINDSWIFGYKRSSKEGFNFRVDMLKPQEILPKPEGLGGGINVMVSQAHALNGHISVPEDAEEKFVTANHAWFREIATNSPLHASHDVKGVLCRFIDESGFYAVSLPEADALKGAIAGRFDANGKSKPMSQFIDVESREGGATAIRVLSPHQNIVLSEFVQDKNIVAGVAEVEAHKGFCILSADSVGQTLNVEGKEDA